MGVVLQIIMLFLLVTVTAAADTYRWVDDRGVIHFTDDPAAVPKRFEKKVKVIPNGDAVPPVQVPSAGESAPAPTPSPVPGASPSAVRTFGGHDETWWRGRYGALRNELKDLQAALPAKKVELEQAQRTYTLNSYTRNRIAYQNKEAEVQQLEARIATQKGALEALDQEATRAGVPFEWRQ